MAIDAKMEWISTAEAAATYDYAEVTVPKALKSGRLAGVKIAGR